MSEPTDVQGEFFDFADLADLVRALPQPGDEVTVSTIWGDEPAVVLAVDEGEEQHALVTVRTASKDTLTVAAYRLR